MGIGNILLRRALVRRVVISLLALVSMVGIYSIPAAQAHGADPHSITIVAHDDGTHFSYTFSHTELAAGLVNIRFENRGTQGHMATFAKLKAGVTETQFISVLATSFGPGGAGIGPVLKIATPAGGADSLLPGAHQDVIEHLTPGHYVVICLDTTPQGVPHFLLGMHKSFFVEGRDDSAAGVRGVHTDGTVIQFDFGFKLPRVIREDRRLVLKVHNTSTIQSHEMQILKLPNGMTREQFGACLQGQNLPICQQPITDAGGLGAQGPGMSSWIIIHLKPGTYGVVCFVPDVNTGTPHAFLGMFDVFTVER